MLTGKEMQDFIFVSTTGKPVLPISGGAKRLVARNNSAGELPKNYPEWKNWFFPSAGIKGRAHLVVSQGP